jgi:polysaccharide biosynthesis transport protein
LSDLHTSAASGSPAPPGPARPGGIVRPLAARDQAPPFEEPIFEGEIDLGSYTRTLLRQWKLLLTGAMVGLLMGATVASLRPTLYEASSTILLGNATAPGSGPTARALLANHSLAARMLTEVGLDQPPASWTPHRFVAEALQIEEVAGTALVRVKVKLPDPIRAAEASKVLSREAVDLNRQIATEQSTAVGAEISRHLSESSQRLETAEQALLAYRNEAQMDVLRTDADAKLEERGTLLRLLIDIETEKARLAAAEQEIQKHDRVLPAARAVRSEDSLRRAAKSGQGAQGTASGLADPDVLDLSEPFMNPVYQTLAFQISTSRTRLAGLERQRSELAARKVGDTQFAELSELNRRELQLARLEGSYDLARSVHDDLALRFEQSRTASVINMVQLQLVDGAVPPDRPLSKKRIQSAGLGLVAGLLGAIALVIAWGMIQGSGRNAVA